MWRFSAEKYKKETGVMCIPGWVKEMDGKLIFNFRKTSIGDFATVNGYIIQKRYCICL